MENGNGSEVKELILLGFSYTPQIKIGLFVILFQVYSVNLTANSLFIALSVGNSKLHSPMYFFLCNLSLVDICFSSVCAPTILEGLLVERIVIPISECTAQMYVSLSLGEVECLLLAVMAWDRYVAICKPLTYQQMMSNRICINLAICTWAGGFIFALPSVVVRKMVHFCRQNIIDHTICEVEAISQITCMDNQFPEIANLFSSLVTLVFPVSFILFTYFWIISTILRMPTAESRRRTFATCGSHLMVVALFYGTAMLVYMSPKSRVSTEKDKLLSLLYVLLVPALNPLIYTLRNAEVNKALRKLTIRVMPSLRSRA